jgi:hypothetical protein
VVSVTCFLSLGLVLFCGCIQFVAKCVCAISVSGLGIIWYYVIHNSKINKNNNKKKTPRKSMGRDEQTKTNKQETTQTIKKFQVQEQ